MLGPTHSPLALPHASAPKTGPSQNPHMKFPVFAKGAEPSIDRRIQRKSMSYITEEVTRGRADWVDSADRRKGIICREMLWLGLKPLAPEPECLSPMRGAEIPGIIFKEPASAAWRKDPASRALSVRFLPPEEVFANRFWNSI
jgi:hypothetical protein